MNREADLKMVIDCFTEAIDNNPDYAEGYYYRGFSKCQLGNYEEAIKDFDEALRIDPDFAQAYNYRRRAIICLSDKNKVFDLYYASIIRLKQGDASETTM